MCVVYVFVFVCVLCVNVCCVCEQESLNLMAISKVLVKNKPRKRLHCIDFRMQLQKTVLQMSCSKEPFFPAD